MFAPAMPVVLRFIEPCLPSPADRPPSGTNWIHEIKHDGYRLMARRDSVGIRLITRRGKDWSERATGTQRCEQHHKPRFKPLRVLMVWGWSAILDPGQGRGYSFPLCPADPERHPRQARQAGRVVLLRAKGEILGDVEAPDAAAANRGPVDLDEVQRTRIIVQEYG